TLRDDLLARLDAVGDDPIEAIAGPRGDVAHLDDVVRADHRHIRRSLKVAYGGMRYDGRVEQILHQRSDRAAVRIDRTVGQNELERARLRRVAGFPVYGLRAGIAQVALFGDGKHDLD